MRDETREPSKFNNRSPLHWTHTQTHTDRDKHGPRPSIPVQKVEGPFALTPIKWSIQIAS